ncbi:hypothetical protein DPMN_148836 [Dreissena polymorpha]|uniref:Uncharacterized protein n=1 Tax=Dreissena polymorpha TaxID=45954 RepID=A0A9D4FGB4_DREPO|nr:hypothetical protein DPMN_148836 [Dreissena polymorpha]
MSVNGYLKPLHDDVCVPKMADRLVDVCVCVIEPHFCENPRVFVVRRKEDRVVVCWVLEQLYGDGNIVSSFRL